MSVFEVLRYNEIDLTDLEALLALPDVIVLKYWLVVHEDTFEYEPAPQLDVMCFRLSRWAKSASTPQDKEFVKNKFLKALRTVHPQ